MAIETVFTHQPTQAQDELFEAFSTRHWGARFHEDDASQDFFDFPDLIAELFVDSTLVAGLVIFLRHLEYRGQTYSFAGIGGVVTHQNYRHHGYATRLLQDALREISSRCDFALLCTDIPRLGPLYGGVGFVPLGRPYYFIDKNGLKKPEPSGMIAPLSSPDVVKLILSTPDEIFVGTSNF